MAVNVSVRQLIRPGFAAEVVTRLVDHDIHPARLSLEVLESQLIEQPGLALGGLLELQGAGIHIGIDDFGTGGTSMTYLRDLPATLLKIDRSLVESLPEEGRDRAVVGAVLQLAHAQGAPTVAKGARTAGQLDSLHEVGCDFAQGHLFGEPRPASAIRLTR